MDTTTVSATSGWTLYDVFLQGTNIYNGTTSLVATSGATWTACAIARSEIGTTGIFGPPTLTNLPAGTYTREIRRRIGASAAQTDPALYIDTAFAWDGSAPLGGGVVVTPIVATANNPLYATRDVPKMPKGAQSVIAWTVVDSQGSAINLSGKTVRCVVFTRDAGDEDDASAPFDDTLTGSFKYETGGGGIVVSGASSNVVTLTHSAAKTATAGAYEFMLWNVTDKIPLIKGKMPIEPALIDV